MANKSFPLKGKFLYQEHAEGNKSLQPQYLFPTPAAAGASLRRERRSSLRRRQLHRTGRRETRSPQKRLGKEERRRQSPPTLIATTIIRAANEWNKNDDRLLQAVENGDTEKVASLLGKKGASATKLDSEGKTAELFSYIAEHSVF
uniref:Uncharacterized protein n=1 Tax=Sphaerodactylus townsendi TaxID=933632 RepID=A0ACB8EPP8_9SAUR